MARLTDDALAWIAQINSDPDVRDMAKELLNSRLLLVRAGKCLLTGEARDRSDVYYAIIDFMRLHASKRISTNGSPTNNP